MFLQDNVRNGRNQQQNIDPVFLGEERHKTATFGKGGKMPVDPAETVFGLIKALLHSLQQTGNGSG